MARRVRGARVTRNGKPATELVCASIDPEIWAQIADESSLMGDPDEAVTIRRRLAYGNWLTSIVDHSDLRWRPIRHGATAFEFELDRMVVAELKTFAELCGYGLDVVIATILTNDLCKPPEVLNAEQVLNARKPRALRWERGHGHIYPASFELPGYQLVFLRLLSPSVVKRDAVVGEALVALARQVHHVRYVAGLEISDEARAFARKMINWPGR